MRSEYDDQIAELSRVLGDQPRRRFVDAHAEHAHQVRVEQAAQELDLPGRVRAARLGGHAAVVRNADVQCLAHGHLAQVRATQLTDHVQTVPRYLRDVRLATFVRLTHAGADVPRHQRWRHLQKPYGVIHDFPFSRALSNVNYKKKKKKSQFLHFTGFSL